MTGTKHKVAVCRDLGDEAMSLLRERDDVQLVLWPKDSNCDRKWLLDNADGAEAIIVLFCESVDDELLDRVGPSLKVVSTMSVGYEHVSLPALAKRGIRLGYTPDVLTDAVADIAVMLALMATRNAKATMELVQEGEWPKHVWSPFGFCGPQISSALLPPLAYSSSSQGPSGAEKVAGFLGFGRIAQATLARLVAFGIRRCIYAGNPARATSSVAGEANDARDMELARKLGLAEGSIRSVGIEELAAQSDVLFVLAPASPSTYHVVDEKFLSQMKKSAVLVNSGRGALVDSDALAKALRERWIWGAGLDVVEGEPKITKDHPLVKEPRCAILPHIGSATFETRTAMAKLTVRNAIAGIFNETMPAELDIARQI